MTFARTGITGPAAEFIFKALYPIRSRIPFLAPPVEVGERIANVVGLQVLGHANVYDGYRPDFRIVVARDLMGALHYSLAWRDEVWNPDFEFRTPGEYRQVRGRMRYQRAADAAMNTDRPAPRQVTQVLVHAGRHRSRFMRVTDPV